MDQQTRMERAAKARALLADPLLKEVFDALEDRYSLELMQAPVGNLTSMVPHAKLKALNEIHEDLKSISEDQEFLSFKRRRE